MREEQPCEKLASHRRENPARKKTRAELFEEMIPHLDFVAYLDEQEYGQAHVSRRIREVLIPLLERESGFTG